MSKTINFKVADFNMYIPLWSLCTIRLLISEMQCISVSTCRSDFTSFVQAGRWQMGQLAWLSDIDNSIHFLKRFSAQTLHYIHLTVNTWFMEGWHKHDGKKIIGAAQPGCLLPLHLTFLYALSSFETTSMSMSVTPPG